MLQYVMTMLVIGQVKFKLKVTAMLLYVLDVVCYVVVCYVVVDGSVGLCSLVPRLGSPGTRIFIARRAWYLSYVSMTSAK